MAKSFDKYILKEIASPFSIGLLVYTFTLLINMIFMLSGTLISKEASAFTVLQILVYMLPDFLSFTIPMATLMGVLAGLSRMSTDSEIIAFRTMGVNNFRILKPILRFSFIAFLFSTWLIMYMAPEAGFRLSKLMLQIGIKRAVSAIKPGDFYTEFPYYTLYFSDKNKKTDEWQDVILHSRKDAGMDTFILAKTGSFVRNQDEKASYIVLRNVLVHSFKKEDPQKSFSLTSYVSMKERVDDPQEVQLTRRERQLIFPELVRRYKRDPGNRMLGIEFNRKFALPFACLALAFLGLSLGISTKKGGKVSGFIISLGIIFIYYTVSVSTENMILKGSIKPFLGMWSANFFLLAVGIAAYYYSSKEKSINWERLFAFAEKLKKRFKKHERQKEIKKERKVVLVIKFPIPRLKFRIFKILDKYVIKRLTLTFMLVFSSLIMVFYVIKFVEKIDDAVEHKVSALYVLKYIFFDTPETISFVLPVASLTAVLLTFSVMSKNNEITAVKVSGISLYRLIVPTLVFGIILCLGFFYIQEEVTPGANKQRQEVSNIINKRETKTEDEYNKNWVMGKDGIIYFYDFLDKNSDQIVNFNAVTIDKNFTITRRISAKSARWDPGNYLVLQNGFERSLSDNNPIGYYKFKSKPIYIEEGKGLFTRKIAFSEFMNIKELKKYIAYLKGKKSETHKYEAQLYYKYAFPFSSLIMVLIAIPFSFMMGNKGTLYGIGIAITISIVFWFSFAVFSALGAAAILSPFLSGFAPLFIFTGVSIYLFSNIKT